MKKSKAFIVRAISVTVVILVFILSVTALSTNNDSKPDNDKSQSSNSTLSEKNNTAKDTRPEKDSSTKNNNSGSTSSKPTDTTKPESTTKKPQTYEGKLIALTYDDGPFPRTTNRILDVLEKNNSKCTFFVVGDRVEGYADTIKRASGLGCEIANHSYSHEYLTKISDSEVKSQINDVDTALKSSCGLKTSLLRVPGGMHNENVRNLCDMPIILWSVDTLDWKYKKTSGSERTERQNKIISQVLENAQDGDIVLMHDIYDFTAELSEQLIPKLIEKGFKLVTVSELFASKGVELSPGTVYNSARVSVSAEASSTAQTSESAQTTENAQQ